MSIFHYDADHLIAQGTFADLSSGINGDLYFSNASRTTAKGFDSEVEGRWASGITAALSYSHTRATDRGARAPLSNSPRHLTTLRVASPAGLLSSRVGLTVRGISERRDLDGRGIAGVILGNVTSTTPIGKKLDVEFDLYNLANARYADPGAEEHVQRAIAQDGRTFRVRLVARF